MLRVNGVREIAVLGGDTPDFLVQLNPTALLTRGVTAQDVQNALAKNNQITAGGAYDQSFLRYDVLSSGLLQNTQDIANVTVAVKNRIPVTIGQVGIVTRGVEPHTIASLIDLLCVPRKRAHTLCAPKLDGKPITQHLC
jgi:Cu/Ag efflux pump CusA